MAQGYHAAAMDEIAERAGVSKPVLYQHFPGKHELYMALMSQYADEVTGSVREGLSASRDNRARGFGAIAAFFDLIDRQDESFRLIFESDLNDPEVRSLVESVHEQCAQMIAVLIHEETGLPDDEALLLAMALGGMAHTSARFWLRAGRTMPREEAIRLVAQLTWGGLAGFPRVDEDGGEVIQVRPANVTARHPVDLRVAGTVQPVADAGS